MRRFDSLETSNKAEHAELAGRIDGLERRMDSLESKLETYHSQIHDDVNEVLTILRSDV